LAVILAALALATAQSLGADEMGACWDYGTLFTRVGPEWGVRAYGRSLGVNLSDFDGDGRTDIYVAMAPSRVEGALVYPGDDLVYLQRADGTFEEAAASLGLGDLCEDRSPLRGDLDGDGLADLFVTVNGRSLSYRNEGGWFEDVTAWSGAAGHVGWGHQGVLLDYDGDRWLDVFFTNGPEDGAGPNTLLHNARDGTFRDASIEAAVVDDPSGKGACVLDADLDGAPDLFVTTGREYGNHLYMNEGDGRFVDEAVERGASDPLQRFGVGVSCGDLDGDGDPDILLVTHDRRYTGNLLYRNDGGRFVDVAGTATDPQSSAPLQSRIDGHGSVLADLDLDGDLDVVLSGFNVPPHVYVNESAEGAIQFRRACGGLGIAADDLLSWGIASADLTGDGYPEVYVSNGLGLQPRDDELFAYTGPGANHWIGIDAVGRAPDTSALGAKVEVHTARGTATRWVGGWSAFDSQGDHTVVVGLGDETIADVTVTFAGGTVVEQPSIAIDRVVRVVEPALYEDADRDGVPDDDDRCPGTMIGRAKDAEGCAIGQRGGLAVAPTAPAPNEVITGCFSFAWAGESDATAVVQVSADGTFGPAERIDFGPTSSRELLVCDEDLEMLRSASDGSTPFVWRVALADDDGNEALSLPSAFYVALPVREVGMPDGANVFAPAHVVVSRGSRVSWRNDAVAEGNLQNAVHDVALVDGHGAVITEMHEFDGGGVFSYTFPDSGVWHYLCQQHSGAATPTDSVHETNGYHHHATDGPYRCMAGTVTVE
jgi:enediyne biosynthesis protein E4